PPLQRIVGPVTYVQSTHESQHRPPRHCEHHTRHRPPEPPRASLLALFQQIPHHSRGAPLARKPRQQPLHRRHATPRHLPADPAPSADSDTRAAHSPAPRVPPSSPQNTASLYRPAAPWLHPATTAPRPSAP